VESIKDIYQGYLGYINPEDADLWVCDVGPTLLVPTPHLGAATTDARVVRHDLGKQASKASYN
jgi:hypothetical protein